MIAPQDQGDGHILAALNNQRLEGLWGVYVQKIAQFRYGVDIRGSNLRHCLDRLGACGRCRR